jgi:hypothetical protein
MGGVGGHKVTDSTTGYDRVSGTKVAHRTRQGPSNASGFNADRSTDGDQSFGALVQDKAAAYVVSGHEEDVLFRYDVCKDDQVPLTAHARPSLHGRCQFYPRLPHEEEVGGR